MCVSFRLRLFFCPLLWVAEGFPYRPEALWSLKDFPLSSFPFQLLTPLEGDNFSSPSPDFPNTLLDLLSHPSAIFFRQTLLRLFGFLVLAGCWFCISLLFVQSLTGTDSLVLPLTLPSIPPFAPAHPPTLSGSRLPKNREEVRVLPL